MRGLREREKAKRESKCGGMLYEVARGVGFRPTSSPHVDVKLKTIYIYLSRVGMARGATPTSSNLLRLCQLHTACKTAWNDAYSPLFTMEAAALKGEMNLEKEGQQRRYSANKWIAEGEMAASRRRLDRSGPSSSLSPWFTLPDYLL